MALEGYWPITTITGSGNPASIDITSIPSTYAHLCLIGNMASTRATALEQFTLHLGSPTIDTGANYGWQRLGITNSTTVGEHRNTGMSNMYLLDSLGSTVASLTNPMVECLIFGYADTNRYTHIWAKGGYAEGATYGSSKLWVGNWLDTSVVSALRVTAGSGNFTTTSRLTLYGFKA